MAAKKIAYAIARESADDRTLQNQYDNLYRVAKKMGYEIVAEFGENVSGDVTKKEGQDPNFIEELRLAISKRKPDAIFCYWIDRLTRTTYKQGAYLNEFSVVPKIPICFTREEKWTIDPNTKKIDDDFLAELASDQTPQKERENITARTRPQREKLGSEGYYIGHLSDGYCVEESWGTYEDGRRRKIKKIVIDEDRKKVIEDIFRYYRNGYSTDKIAKLLNADNVPTTNRYRAEHHEKFGHRQKYVGKDKIERDRGDATWNGSLVGAILNNEWYKGVRHYMKTELHHDYIISPEEWEEVESIRKERKKSFRNMKETTKHLYLLSNLIFCSRCGRKLYGHYTGLNNHYYCPSSDQNEKCGLVGICKENIEAIVHNVIMINAIRTIARGEDDITVDFFKIDKATEQRIKEEIENNNKIISKYRNDIEKASNAIDFYIDEQGNFGDNGDMVRRYKTKIVAKQDEIEEKNTEIKKLEAENRANKRKLNIGSDVKDIIKNIIENKELSIIKQLFKQTIEKVILFNTEKTNDIIRVYYKNGNQNEIIYSSGLMKGGYILLMPPLYYDENENLIESSQYPLFLHIINGKTAVIKDRRYENINDLLPGIDLAQIECIELNSGFTVDEYIHLVRETSLTSSFERLEEEPEVAKAQRKHYQEWRKKYNTGRPTSVQYVIHNETYEEIQKKRKYLYNRIDKIKHKKSLSDEEKKQQIQAIRNQLDILTVQVPTLKPRKKRSKKQ